jgi:hypothetical protein
MFGTVRNLWQRLLRRTGQDRDAAYMRQLRGVIHVGANTGQGAGPLPPVRLAGAVDRADPRSLR